MSQDTINYAGLYVKLPVDWHEITSSLDGGGDLPLTVAKEDGIGALQFSVGFYNQGPIPNPTARDLLQLATDFGKAKNLDVAFDVACCEDDKLRIGAASFRWDTNFIRVWYASDGYSFAFVTYTCDWKDQSSEVAECEQIVQNLTFPTVAAVQNS